MKIKTDQYLPLAGEQYPFSVEGVIGEAVIEVYIDNHLLYRQECDDPPCHEMIMIPQDARGSDLSIIATDTSGKTEKREFKIAGSDTGVGGLISK